MDRRRPRHGRRPLPCASRHPDDGIDPRRETDDAAPRGADRKTLRLCGAAARALSTALEGLVRDEGLFGARVARVLPDPDASRLRVEVVAPAGADPRLLLARLAAAHAFLRAEVAASVVRKRAPDLAFTVRPAEEAR